MSPQRVQLRRTKGWRKPPNTVVVARPSKWGNPFRMDQYPKMCQAIDGGDWFRLSASARRRFAVDDFAAFVRAAVADPWRQPVPIELRIIAESIDELRGKNLACWCPLDQPCHADVLLELANAEAAS